MVFFEWDDSYSVNVEEIDEQHRDLFQLINEMHDVVMNDRKTRGTVTSMVNELRTMAAVLDELVAYAADHFSTEERCMRECCYPELAQHRKEHEDFADRIQAFKRGLDEGEAIRPHEILTFLKDWWRQHIMNVDKKYVPCLREAGCT
ncbi:MAG: bacteriohemerythrin [Planctomycetota bacterium]|jgi:hemerythrin